MFQQGSKGGYQMNIGDTLTDYDDKEYEVVEVIESGNVTTIISRLLN